MRTRSADRPVDRTGDPHERVGATEAARILGYTDPDKLPRTLLQRAETAATPDGAVGRRTWTRSTLWEYADTTLSKGTTVIDGRRAVDRHGIAALAGLEIHRVATLLREGSDNGLPAPARDGWYYEDDIEAWNNRRVAAQQEQLTDLRPASADEDPDELITKAEAARMLNYTDVNSLNKTKTLRLLMERNRDEDNQKLPSGGTRYRWPRRVVREVAQHRSARRGRTPGSSAATRTVDTTGDPNELVGVTETARVLGYSHPSAVPKSVRDKADQPGPPARWHRRTLWKIAGLTPPAASE